MKLGGLLASGHITDTIDQILPDSPLLRTGAATVATRWAMRSIPAAFALVAAGAAYRFWKTRRGEDSRPSRSTRKAARPAKSTKSRKAQGSAKKPAPSHANGADRSAPAAAAAA